MVAAGLAQDFRGLPFGAMPTLLCVAEFVDKLEAVCHRCGGPATMTQRLLDGEPGAVRRRDDPGRRARLVRRRGCRAVLYRFWSHGAGQPPEASRGLIRNFHLPFRRYHRRRGPVPTEAFSLLHFRSGGTPTRSSSGVSEEPIFARSWQYGGRADQVAEPGSFPATDAGGIPLLVVRDREGELRAFLNVCRHRGSVLMEGGGTRETIQCHYHAWTYDLDGALRSAPRSGREPGFDKADWSLLPASVDTWGPFLFVNPSPEAQPLAEGLGDLPEIMAPTSTCPRSSSTRASPSGPTRTGRSSRRTSSSATTAPSAHPSFSAEGRRLTRTAISSRRLRRSPPQNGAARADRSAASSTCSSRTRASTSSRAAEPLDRPDRPARRRAAPIATSTTSSAPTSTTNGLRTTSRSTNKSVGGRLGRSVRDGRNARRAEACFLDTPEAAPARRGSISVPSTSARRRVTSIRPATGGLFVKRLAAFAVIAAWLSPSQQSQAHETLHRRR